MTDQDWIDLGRRAVACRGWRWMAGMRMMRPHCDEVFRVCDEPANAEGHVHIGGSPYDWAPEPDDVIPDLRDPATVGCLLALVREAWGAAHIRQANYVNGPRAWQCACNDGDGWTYFSAPAEAHALVAALESAPEPTP